MIRSTTLGVQTDMEEKHPEMDHQDTPPPVATTSTAHESVGETDNSQARDTPEAAAPKYSTEGTDTPLLGTPNRSPCKQFVNRPCLYHYNINQKFHL